MGVPAKQPTGPQLAVNEARPQFWKVAPHNRDDHYLTPFQRLRMQNNMPPQDMADYMDLPLGDYTDFENGFVRPDVDHILTFCKAIRSHPLDLYPSTSVIAPLPPEILQCLLRVMDDSAWDKRDKTRANARLELETRSALSVLKIRAREMMPLWISIGVSPTMQGYNAPFYMPEGMVLDRGSMSNAEEGLASVLYRLTEDTPRSFLEKCLNAYQLDLERECTERSSIMETINKAIEKNEKRLENSARVLYGDKGRDGAIKSMLNLIPQCDRETLREQFNRNPAMIMALDRIPTPSMLRHFFDAACASVKYDAMMKRSNPEDRFDAATERLEDFLSWRERPRTRQTLDWFENMCILCYMPDHRAEANPTFLPSVPQPRLFRRAQSPK